MDFEVKGRYIQYGSISKEMLHQNNDELGLGCCFLPVESRKLLQGTGILKVASESGYGILEVVFFFSFFFSTIKQIKIVKKCSFSLQTC